MAKEQTYGSIYRAKVLNNVDPNNSGRVEVLIPGLSGPQNTTFWARPASAFGYNPTSQGSFVVPSIGSQVYIFFENGDPSFPIYFAGVVLEQQVLPSAQIDGSNVREFVIYQSPNNNIIRVSDNKNKIILQTTNGSLITIDNSTNQIEISSTGNINVLSAATINVNAQATINVNAQSDITITSNTTVTINASDLVTISAPVINMG